MSIEAKTILDLAEQFKEGMVADRREIHKNPEVGACLPKTKEYVKKRLSEMGYEPVEICESGIVATITGEDTGKCILLRADMDGLKVQERTELDFKSENGNMHACGHDMHTAMLLGAAKLLKEQEKELKGTVKLVFQPDEEGFTGAKTMLKAGVLQNPAPEAGLALHVHSGSPSGLVLCGRGTCMAGCTLFRVRVKGVGCHGAMPETGVDPINIAAHIYLALQEITAREIPAKSPAVVTIGKFSGGQAPNIIPQDAVIEGTIRTFDRDLSASILQRIQDISEATAKAFRGSAVVEEMASAPPLINNPELANQMAGFVTELFVESPPPVQSTYGGRKMESPPLVQSTYGGRKDEKSPSGACTYGGQKDEKSPSGACTYGGQKVYLMDEGGMGSEDFSSYTYEIPCAYLLIGAGTKDENPLYGEPMHNEKVVFNEDILWRGAAIHTYCAMKWLEQEETK